MNHVKILGETEPRLAHSKHSIQTGIVITVLIALLFELERAYRDKVSAFPPRGTDRETEAPRE